MQRVRTVLVQYLWRRIHLVAICAAIIAAYYPTFGGEFILDDIPFVKDNPSVHGFQKPASYFLQEDGIIGDEVGRGHSGYYRPLTNLTYSLDYLVWGLKGAGFRTTNLFLHIITCLMLYLCLVKLLKEPTGPLVAVLLFGLHPANTESVAWVSSRNNILVSLFSLASFYFYIRRTEECRPWQGALSLLFFALALLSKEFAAMLLPIFFIYDRVVAGDRKSFREGIWGYLAFLSVLIGYLVLRKVVIQDLVLLRYTIGDFWKALYFSPYLILENLRIILLPAGLHNFIIGYPRACLGKEALLGFAGVALMGWLLWRWRNHRFVLFSSLSFFLSLFPILNIVPTSAFSLVSMRWLYFPMCFLCFSAASWLSRKAIGKRVFLGYATISAVAVFLGAYTTILNQNLWKNEAGFFFEEVAVFGNDFFAADLARYYQKAGKLTEAERLYEIAEKKGPRDRAALLINYAALLIESDRAEAALGRLKEAESLGAGKHAMGLLWNNKGAAFFKIKEFQKAAQCFELATKFAPKEPSYVMNLGHAFMACGEDEKAAEAYERGRSMAAGQSK